MATGLFGVALCAAMVTYLRDGSDSSTPSGQYRLNLATTERSDQAVLLSVNQTIHVIVGKRTGNGCEFPLPYVQRRADGNLYVLATSDTGELSEIRNMGGMRAVTISQGNVDLDRCQETWTIGPLEEESGLDGKSQTESFSDVEEAELPKGAPTPGDGGSTVPAAYESSAWRDAIPVRARLKGVDGQARQSSASLASGSSSAWFQIRYEDLPGFDVTKTKATVNWNWDGTCGTYGTGSRYDWWRAPTGWSLNSFSGGLRVNGSCPTGYNVIFTNLDAEFLNGVFCAGVNTWVIKDDVHILGYADGTWAGGAVGLQVIEPWWCPPLHWEQDYIGS